MVEEKFEKKGWSTIIYNLRVQRDRRATWKIIVLIYEHSEKP